MSSFSGIFGSSPGGFLGAALDPSHHPFKRSAKRPGGPGKRPDKQAYKWQCEWMPPAKGAYRQKCYDVTKPGNKPKIVKIPKAKKKRYNKLYRAGKFPRARRFKVDKVHAGAAYAPRKSRTWAKASKKKR